MAGKWVLITGGAGVVGRACLEVFRDRGAKVVLSDRARPEGLPDDVAFFAADVCNRAEVTAAYAAISDQCGQIAAAVLAAGLEGPVAPVEDITEADLDRVLAVNVKGALFWMQACLQDMKPRGGGSIVALSSISGVVGTPLLAAYAISKHAVLGLVRSAALESGPAGVRINAVCPGPVESDMMRRLDAAFVAHDPKRFGGGTNGAMGLPTQRYVAPAEVAGLVAFLCSDAAASCHGGTYMVDGGFTAK